MILLGVPVFDNQRIGTDRNGRATAVQARENDEKVRRQKVLEIFERMGVKLPEKSKLRE